MSEKKDDGAPAFPVGNPEANIWGMTLRDWFAGQAMGALLTKVEGQAVQKIVAQAAYIIADAMLAARK